MLIRYNNEPIINLDNVSNVFIDRKNNKIIFNMNYAVKLNGNLSADYQYWHYKDDEFDKLLISLEKVLIYHNFIVPNSIYNRYVNTKCISSIKIDYNNLKVIFNLNATVSHPEDVRNKVKFEKQRFTSDFVFIKFRNEDEFYDYIEQFENDITII